VAQRRSTAPIGALDTHPNADEIRGILSRLPCITDTDLPLLAESWHNTTLLAEARRRALEPDSPLVIEVLACFDTVQALFADELRGNEDYVVVDPEVTSTALKGVRDAVAAAYARPILTIGEHEALMKAWRSVYPTDHVVDPDLGSRSEDVTCLLLAVPQLAARCHEPTAAAEYASILLAAESLDEDIRCAARDEAWHAAVLTSRRRVWQLIRRSGVEGLNRYCTVCHERQRDEDTARVITLCIDAACGLLVAGHLDDDIVDVLTEPVKSIVPAKQPPSVA
jgi:hypothetical protein